MTFPTDPIQPSEGKSEEPIIVNPIEANKETKEDQTIDTPFLPNKKEVVLLFSFLLFLKKITSFLFQKEGEKSLFNETGEDLYHFHTLLNELKQKDLSQNIPFCQQLSTTWSRLLLYKQHTSSYQKSSSLNLKKLDTLIEEINAFPPREDQKLGYYLSHHAGKEWLPFPFMDLLHRLHDEYLLNREESHLGKWSQIVHSILSSLDK